MNIKELFHLLIFNQVFTQRHSKIHEVCYPHEQYNHSKQYNLSCLLLAPSTCYSYRINFHVTYANRVFGRQRAKILNFLPLPLFLKISSTKANSFLQNTLFVLRFKRDYIFPHAPFLLNTYTPFNNEAIKFLSFTQNSQRRRFEINNSFILPLPPIRRSRRRWNLFLKY